ncbi:MAG TPA: sulfotransferase [Steroidobacteraceae bacterium]|nr:sulfotransferase [Steroidobacteraceae bacterium]
MSSDSSIDKEAYRLVQAGRFAEALPIAAQAVAEARVCVSGHALLASILLKLGRLREAGAIVDMAAALPTGTADAYDGLAFVSVELAGHERANALYRRATQISPQMPRFWYNLACSERSFGRLVEAEEACNRAIELDASQYRSYLLRSELRVQSNEANHIGQLQSRLADPHLDAPGRIFLGYALAKELDDVGRFDAAFEWFARAAKARRKLLSYEIAEDERKLRRIEAVFRRAPASKPENEDPRCIFIVGLPRSGTTLVERILTGLPGVRSNGETENFSRALAEAAPKGPGDMFERAAAAPPPVVAANYRRFALVDASGAWVIEKLPTNYLYLGAIRRALPAAKLLWVRRSPLDACFAMFRTLFGEAYPFSYDFDELARYYAAYDRLMQHWREDLGGALHEIVYEELVRNPRLAGAAIAQHCGLVWNSEAIDIQANKSVSLTASAAQVRRPIYGSSSGRWRRYRRHLMPLLDALRRSGVTLPDDA